MSNNEQIILDSVCDLDGCIATLGAMIGAFMGDAYSKFDQDAAICALMLLRDNIERSADRIRELT